MENLKKKPACCLTAPSLEMTNHFRMSCIRGCHNNTPTWRQPHMVFHNSRGTSGITSAESQATHRASRTAAACPSPTQPPQEPELSTSRLRQAKGRPTAAGTSGMPDACTPENQARTSTTRVHPIECKKIPHKAAYNSGRRMALKMHTTATTASQASTTRMSAPVLLNTCFMLGSSPRGSFE